LQTKYCFAHNIKNTINLHELTANFISKGVLEERCKLP